MEKHYLAVLKKMYEEDPHELILNLFDYSFKPEVILPMAKNIVSDPDDLCSIKFVFGKSTACNFNLIYSIIEKYPNLLSMEQCKKYLQYVDNIIYNAELLSLRNDFLKIVGLLEVTNDTLINIIANYIQHSMIEKGKVDYLSLVKLTKNIKNINYMNRTTYPRVILCKLANESPGFFSSAGANSLSEYISINDLSDSINKSDGYNVTDVIPVFDKIANKIKNNKFSPGVSWIISLYLDDEIRRKKHFALSMVSRSSYTPMYNVAIGYGAVATSVSTVAIGYSIPVSTTAIGYNSSTLNHWM